MVRMWHPTINQERFQSIEDQSFQNFGNNRIDGNMFTFRGSLPPPLCMGIVMPSLRQAGICSESTMAFNISAS